MSDITSEDRVRITISDSQKVQVTQYEPLEIGVSLTIETELKNLSTKLQGLIAETKKALAENNNLLALGRIVSDSKELLLTIGVKRASNKKTKSGTISLSYLKDTPLAKELEEEYVLK